MNLTDKAMELLPTEFLENREAIGNRSCEEIRLRLGYKPTVLINGAETNLSSRSVTASDLRKVLEKATGASMHSVSSGLKNGYVNYDGIRIGICGCCSTCGGEIVGFTSYSSLNIRIPGEIRGLFDKSFVFPLQNTLIISPPGGGKTTALRELIRMSSEQGIVTAAADERGELSGWDGGKSCFDLGRCTDTMIGIEKSTAAMMLLRTMNPRLIALDEITEKEDMKAVMDIYGCGVAIYASAHCPTFDELSKRSIYRELLEAKVFRRVICIQFSGSARRYSKKEL